MMADKPKVYIIIYSLYHHIYKLSLAIKEGLEENGNDVTIYQVQETLSDQVLEKMHAPAKPDLPIIQASQLADADGLIFGIPTRFGIFPAQMKTLLDATGQLWAKGSLAGKFVGTFFSTASQHGGQETTALNAVTYFAHHGLIYVPFGFSNASMFNNDEVIGGSAYGSGTITNGDGSRQPSEIELAIAKNQGQNFANVLNTYQKGKKKLSSMTTGADSDASVRSLKAASHNTNGKETPVITTTDPEGQTTQQKHDESAAGAAAAGATTAAVATGAAAVAAGSGNKGGSDNTPAITDAAPGGSGAAANDVSQPTKPSDTNGAAAPTPPPQQPPKPTQEKPKKKSLMSWLCCSSD